MYTKTCKCGCKKVKTFRFNCDYKKWNYFRGHYRKFQVGDKAPGWKGGVVYKRGYVFIYAPWHPHHDQEYVKRSRLEMEKKFNRILESWEFVHHINGIKDDDRIENLFLTTLSEHNSIHGKKRKVTRNKLGQFT